MTEARNDRNDGPPGSVCFPREAKVWFPSPAFIGPEAKADGSLGKQQKRKKRKENKIK